MAAKKNVGTLIREARTGKNLSQEALADAVSGLTASELGKAERGEKELTQAQLKAIAKATGVTQKSLLEAPKGGVSSAASASKKTTSASTKKTSSTASKKTSTSTAKKTSSSGMTLTATEKKLVELYREASSDNKKLVMELLKDGKLDMADLLPTLLSNSGGDDSLLGGLLGKLQGML
ncbi:MAG: helix-turn-helix domain-containing protein [Oscillospiraceae bacterium]|nr:helix-turn-helix domain-containing protein [Oscillospiraceae bacterium]